MRRHNPPFVLKEIKIEVSYRCALSCVHCSSDARPSNALEMSRDQCLQVLAEAGSLGIQDVAFSGGEPLLWPSIMGAVEAAVKHGMNVTLYTSGVVDDFSGKAVALEKIGASRLIFSVFGATAPAHERVTRKSGSFERTMAALGQASAAGLAAELHFVPMAGNYRELREVARLARQIGASRVSVLRLVPQGRAALIRNRALSRLQNMELRREILALRAEFGDDFVRTGSPYNFLMLNDNPACSAAIDRLIVGPDLQIYPCDAFKRIGASEVAGTDAWSCLAGASLSECWERSPFLGAVRAYLTTDFVEPCSKCDRLEECLSGCLAQKAIARNALEKIPDPDCLAVG